MIKLVTDENFDGDVLRGLIRRLPALDVVRVQDVGLSETADPQILEWAAAANRVLLTHDRETIPSFAYDRVRTGQPMPGIILVSDQISKGRAVEEIYLAIECLSDDECKDMVIFIPL